MKSSAALHLRPDLPTPRARRLLPIAAGLALALALGACGDDGGAGPEADPVIPTDHEMPEDFLAAWAQALGSRDLTATLAMLEAPSSGTGAAGFVFVPRASERVRLPWLDESFWRHPIEARLLTNLFDPSLAPAPEVGARVVTGMAVSFTEVNRFVTPEGPTIVVVDAAIRLDSEGAESEDLTTRFELTLAPNEDGFLRLRRQVEEEPTPARATATSWGAIKGRYWLEEIVTDTTDPWAGVLALEDAWENRRSSKIDALLHPDFEFFPHADDVAGILWMTGSSWSRADELAIASNMFDPEVSGPGRRPIERIRISQSLALREDHPDGSVTLTIGAQNLAWYDSTDAGLSDTAFEVLLVPDGLGFLRIREMREIDPPGGAPRRAAETTWGVLKASYR